MPLEVHSTLPMLIILLTLFKIERFRQRVTLMNHWYLIQFKPNSHRLAERNLLRQGFETFLPMQEVTRRKASRFVNDLRPLFPGYMFVSVNSVSVII